VRPVDSLVRVLVLTAFVAVFGAAPHADQPIRYAMTGLVLKVDPAARTVVVSHDAVAGVMPAMSMPFEVRDAGELNGVTAGTRISFTLVLGPRSSHAEQVTVLRYESAEQDPFTTRQLRLLEQLTTGAPKALPVGAMVPDFTLTNQIRKPASLSQLHGKVVALNFIYTSCALPQFCLRVTNHFGAVAKRFKDRVGRDLVLLTVTFDPGRDTPERLAEYARQWNADPAVWQFLTGPAADIERVAGLFGVDFFPDEGLMNHSVHTAVVDRQGRLLANIEGNQFTAAQLGDLVAKALE
jgi:protein SCO1/2